MKQGQSSQKSICVFCSAQSVDIKYVSAAQKFITLMVASKYHLVFGGTDTGLMKVVAEEAQSNGAKITGITIKLFHPKLRKNLDEVFLAKDLGERKALMLSKSDAFVTLVGGIGTLDEVTEIIELKKQGVHNKPIVLINTNNFYEGLHTQLTKMKREGFIPQKLEDFVYFADTPQQAMKHIDRTLR